MEWMLVVGQLVYWLLLRQETEQVERGTWELLLMRRPVRDYQQANPRHPEPRPERHRASRT